MKNSHTYGSKKEGYVIIFFFMVSGQLKTERSKKANAFFLNSVAHRRGVKGALPTPEHVSTG